MTTTTTALQALDPDTLEAIASEIDCFEHSARAASLRILAKRQRAALSAPPAAQDAPSERPAGRVLYGDEPLDDQSYTPIAARASQPATPDGSQSTFEDCQVEHVGQGPYVPTTPAQDAAATVMHVNNASVDLTGATPNVTCRKCGEVIPMRDGGYECCAGGGRVEWIEPALGCLGGFVTSAATPAAHPVAGVADDAALEAAIEASDGAWHDDEFRITGSELMALLRSVAAPTAPQAPLTPAEIRRGWAAVSLHPRIDPRFVAGVEFAERHRGIGITPTTKEQQ